MANKKDSLGDRMKEFYENRTRTRLPRSRWTSIEPPVFTQKRELLTELISNNKI